MVSAGYLGNSGGDYGGYSGGGGGGWQSSGYAGTIHLNKSKEKMKKRLTEKAEIFSLTDLNIVLNYWKLFF